MKWFNSFLEKLMCKHKWSEFNRVFVKGDFKDYTSIILICEECGKIKRLSSH